jgi:hypothetical protein
LCRRRICRLSNSHQAAGHEQKGEGGRQSAGDGGGAPEQNTAGDDFRFIEAVGEVPGGNAGERKNHQQNPL